MASRDKSKTHWLGVVRVIREFHGHDLQMTKLGIQASTKLVAVPFFQEQ